MCVTNLKIYSTVDLNRKRNKNTILSPAVPDVPPKHDVKLSIFRSLCLI